MGALRKSLWMIAAAAVLPAPAFAAQDSGFCDALGRIIAAARERPAFRSVQRRLQAGETIIPGYAAAECRVTAEHELSCGDFTMGRSTFIDWPDLATCPGVTAVPAAAPVNRRPRYSWTRTYRAGNLRIEQGMSCVPCAGPAPSHFTVGLFERPRGRRR